MPSSGAIVTATQLHLPQSPSVTESVTPRYPRKYMPAHECVALGICYWCGELADVEREPLPHITAPYCGCQIRNDLERFDKERDE